MIARLKQDILLQLEDDWVPLWRFPSCIRDMVGATNFDPDEAREVTLQVVEELLEERKFVAGELTDEWRPWNLSNKAVITRIEAEWDALGLAGPNIGSEIVWFDKPGRQRSGKA